MRSNGQTPRLFNAALAVQSMFFIALRSARRSRRAARDELRTVGALIDAIAIGLASDELACDGTADRADGGARQRGLGVTADQLSGDRTGHGTADGTLLSRRATGECGCGSRDEKRRKN
jgi:hypothetical protein